MARPARRTPRSVKSFSSGHPLMSRRYPRCSRYLPRLNPTNSTRRLLMIAGFGDLQSFNDGKGNKSVSVVAAEDASGGMETLTFVIFNQTKTVQVNFTPNQMQTVRDRKSTRLNSSHLGISYAVFCLKK